MSYAPELAAAPKTGRYEIVAVLGRGATSIVYRAIDIEKNFVVALKSLRFPEYDDIYEIKREFRFFRDVHHPNLVDLYDLYAEDEVCFYTMELIDGHNFIAFAQSRAISGEEFRSGLGQLVDGLAALHGWGRLHRDLKPSNILVERDLRTVLLDYGLSVDVRPLDSIVTQSRLYAGTPAYMAPELLSGGFASPESDIYSLGVVLYEALAGLRPFPDGPPIARYEAQRTPPRPPVAVRPNIPTDLSELALALLAFEPSARPTLAEVKRLTRSASATVGRSVVRTMNTARQPFVGREGELARLEDALARVMAGQAVAAHLSGASGVGKTTLMERFLADARERHGALVLRSRCHHQESVRFNAVDGVIDALSRYLMLQDEERLAEIAPEGLPALITVFPVLGRVPFPFGALERHAAASDPHEVMRQAVGAMRALLHEVAARRPVILWIDDLQWSDNGSLPLLREIATVADGRPILPIFSYRTENLHRDSVPIAIARATAEESGIRLEHIPVLPLNERAVAELVRSFSEDDIEADFDWVAEVARESAGLPFFVVELVANSREWSEARSAGTRTSAAGILGQRLRELPVLERTLLEIVAVAGSPLPEEALIHIAAQEGASGREIYQLLNQNLLRKGEVNGRTAVETYHDRIRVAVVEWLDETTRRLRHREIADELSRAPDADDRLLVEHYIGAGTPLLAAESAVRAGRSAAERLAFESAVEFLSLALHLADHGEEDKGLMVELATALAATGRSGEAGDLFLRAARAHETVGDDPLIVASCKAQAAKQFLYGGRLATGSDVYRKVFADLQIPFPTTRQAARHMSLANRIAFTIDLRRLRVRSAAEIPPQAALRLDTLWAASKGFLMLDYVVGDAMLSRYMREAAALGERSRLLRALAIESAVMANVGRPWSIRRGERLMHQAEDLVRLSADPYDRVVLGTCAAAIRWFQGQWREAAELARDAVELHRRDCVRYDFEVPIALGYRVSAMVLMGELEQAKDETLRAIRDAELRGDIYVSRLFKSGYWVYIALAADEPATVIADSDMLLDGATSDRFTSLHWSHFNAKVNALVYDDRGWEAWELVQSQWPLIRATGFLRLGCIGAHLREIRARAALKAAAAPPLRSQAGWTRDRLIGVAKKDARRIAAVSALSHAGATAAAVRAGIAGLCGQPDRRRKELNSALRGFDAAGMSVHRMAAAVQLKALSGQETDHDIEDTVQIAAGAIRNPLKLSRFLMFS